MIKLAVFISGGGSNLQALIDAEKSGMFVNTNIALVVADRECMGLTRAEKANIPYALVKRKKQSDLLRVLSGYAVDRIILSGYLSILPSEVVTTYRNKVINIHPSLIPLFCGMGFYGLRVHEAVIQSGMKVTGVTVHYVDEGVDTGKIIDQRAVRVEESDTPESLRDRVLLTEHELLVDVVKRWTEENGKDGFL